MAQSVSAQPTLLTKEDFLDMAQRLDVDPEVTEPLYPMVRDLLGFAAKLNALAPELGQDIDREAFSLGIGSTLK